MARQINGRNRSWFKLSRDDEFKAAKIIKIFSDYQPCQFAEYYRPFGDHFRPHHQGTAMVVATSAIFNELTRLTAREIFVKDIYAVL
jgi:hypothetical protein